MKAVKLVFVGTLLGLMVGCSESETTDQTQAPSTTTVAAVSQQGDAARGEQLYRKSCTRCHGTEIHTRGEESIIFSFKALVNRIHFCENMAHAGWKEQEFTDVTKYLNDAFYKFQD